MTPRSRSRSCCRRMLQPRCAAMTARVTCWSRRWCRSSRGCRAPMTSSQRCDATMPGIRHAWRAPQTARAWPAPSMPPVRSRPRSRPRGRFRTSAATFPTSPHRPGASTPNASASTSARRFRAKPRRWSARPSSAAFACSPPTPTCRSRTSTRWIRPIARARSMSGPSRRPHAMNSTPSTPVSRRRWPRLPTRPRSCTAMPPSPMPNWIDGPLRSPRVCALRA